MDKAPAPGRSGERPRAFRNLNAAVTPCPTACCGTKGPWEAQDAFSILNTAALLNTLYRVRAGNLSPYPLSLPGVTETRRFSPSGKPFWHGICGCVPMELLQT